MSEEQFKEKFDLVVDELYTHYTPAIIKKFYTKAQIATLVQRWYDQAKKLLLL